MDREITFDDLLNQIEAEGDLQGKLATQVARLSADMANGDDKESRYGKRCSL